MTIFLDWLGAPATPVGGLTWFYGHELPFVPETVSGAPATARSDWESRLVPGFSVLTFESEAPYAGFFGETRTLNGIDISMPMPTESGSPLYDGSFFGIIVDVPDGLGRFNTTPGGSQYLGNMPATDGTSSDPMALTRFEFSPAVSVFGMYLTDIGDFNGEISVRITASDLTTETYVLSTGDETDGYLTFIGFIDASKTYTKIEFICTAGSADAFGIDDVVVGSSSMIA